MMRILDSCAVHIYIRLPETWARLIVYIILVSRVNESYRIILFACDLQ